MFLIYFFLIFFVKRFFVLMGIDNENNYFENYW